MGIWSDLQNHYDSVKDRSLTSLFDDNQRFDAFSAKYGDMLLDFSKTNLDHVSLSLLLDLAIDSKVEERRNAMFAGEKINKTEDRAVLHTALRYQGDQSIIVDDHDVMPEVRTTLEAMGRFSEDVRTGKIRGCKGDAISDVVNIGIGGSDLGPRMATLALAPYHDGPRTHFVSNVDGAHIHDILQDLEPTKTLIIVASKTFTTIETMTNAKTARDWLLTEITEDDVPRHLAALSSAEEKTGQFGVLPERVFGFEDWVGGRYSLWGPIGLPIMLAIGHENFMEFLTGAHEMDQHFLSAPLSENLPVLAALVGVWHSNICGYDTRAILPYDQRLARLPAYLQQLDMESNGKSVQMDGAKVPVHTGPIVWGEPGTNGQHAFYQLIHQGTRVIPCEFLVAREGHEDALSHHHDLLLANCIAQSEALMVGRPLEVAKKLMADKGFTGAELEMQAAHRVFAGNRPSVTMMYDKLTPNTLGRIIAFYEHKVFVEGVIWGINSFDQWGVELGKELAVELLPILKGDASGEHKDGSTQGLIASITK